MSNNNTFTKLKQVLKEFWDKKIKTVDVNYENRLKYVNHLELKVKDIFSSVQNFVRTTQGNTSLITNLSRDDYCY